MTDRQKPHNGRDLSGHYSVRREDVDDILTDVSGPDIIREDVRHDGAVADIGLEAAAKAHEIEHLIDENRENVRRLAGKADAPPKARGRKH